MMKITKAEYLISAVTSSTYPKHSGPEFVFLGRSNVGKSSLINAFVNRKQLAYTSGKPGKTITLNFYQINDAFMFVDVPGYGFAKRGHELRNQFGAMMDEYFSQRSQLKLAFLVVDSRHEPSENDQIMLSFLRHHAIKTIVLATKVDKIGKTLVAGQIKKIKNALKLNSEEIIIPVSAFDKTGIEQLHTVISAYCLA